MELNVRYSCVGDVASAIGDAVHCLEDEKDIPTLAKIASILGFNLLEVPPEDKEFIFKAKSRKKCTKNTSKLQRW